MPAIGTSSDQYQNHDPALTTYRRNTAAPALRQAMTERSEDRSKAAAIERRQVEGRSSLDPSPPPAQLAAQRNMPMITPAKAAETVPVATPASERNLVTPPKVMHSLYEPPSRLKREHDDRYSMITGGTVDVRV